MLGGANEMMGVDDDLYSSSFANVFLSQDEKVLITMGLHLAFYKASGNVPEKRMPETGETEEVPEPQSTLSPASDNEIRPEIKEAIDSYEGFIDEYCAFMEKYDSSDYSMLTQYLKLVEKELEMTRQFEAITDSDLTTAESLYYTEVNLRCTQKMLQVISK